MLKKILESIFHKEELKRLHAENEHLIVHNKKIENRLRERHLDLQALKKMQKRNRQ